jgi:hypothetical protein
VAADATLEAADVDDLTGSLVDRSMLVVESGPFSRRFRMLETMRQFGAEHLSASGETDLLAERHARWCADRVAHIGRQLAGHDEIEGATRLDELWPNLRAAIDWACTTGDRRLAHALLRPIVTEVYVRSRSEIGDWAERLLAVTPADDEDLILFGVTWAARRYMRTMDRDGYQRLVGRYGEPDHPMIRFGRAFLYSDLAGMVRWAPVALDGLRERGEDDIADRFAVSGLATALLLSGHLEEHDAVFTELLEQFRAHGPPTCLNWTLTYLGTSAAAQGKHDLAWRYYDAAAQVAVPAGTLTQRNPVEARAALRRGDPVRAFVTLRAYIGELLERDNMYMAKIGCAEFVSMMATVECWPAAAHMLDYLESSGAFGDSPALRRIVADAATAIGAEVERSHGPEPSGRDLDDREALAYMCRVLDQLTAEARLSG